MVRQGTALAAIALVGTTIACSDPKPPASKGAIDAALGTGACQFLPFSQTTISYGDPVPGGARITDGESDYSVSCSAFGEGAGFRVTASMSGGGRAIYMNGFLTTATSDSDDGCFSSSEAPAGHLVGQATVNVSLNGRGYAGEDGDCWISVGPNDYSNGKARGILCCHEIAGETSGDVCAISGADFVIENCDVVAD